MSRLTELLTRAKAENKELGEELEQEFKMLANRRAFGLNFERHQPESIELPGRAIQRGEKVHILPARGKTQKSKSRLWKVISIDKKTAKATLRALDKAEPQEAKEILDDDFEDVEGVRVSRKIRESYRLSGRDGKLSRTLPRNSFPDSIIEWIKTVL